VPKKNKRISTIFTKWEKKKQQKEITKEITLYVAQHCEGTKPPTMISRFHRITTSDTLT